MKVLYVAPFDSTGYGRAALEDVLSLDAAGVDVVPRRLELGAPPAQPPPRFLELQKKSERGCDVCLQRVLPSMFQYDGRFRLCVGLYASETTSILGGGWAERVNQMDAAVLINEQMLEAARASGVTVPLAVVPHACDPARYGRSYRPLPALKAMREEGNFLFYTVGEFVRRKDFGALLRAFHAEFDPAEPVQLVLKTSLPGADAEKSLAEVRKFCSTLKGGLRLYPREDDYKAEVLLVERLSDEDVMRLHASCDCFVQPSHGEAFSYPCFDAMAMGRTPVATDWGGYRVYLSEETGWPVSCRIEPAFGAAGAPPGLYTARDGWASVDVNDLRRALRAAYTHGELRRAKAAAGLAKACEFSHEAVGHKLRTTLERFLERKT